MLVATLTFVLSNTGVLLFVVAILVALIKLRDGRGEGSIAYRFWGEILFYSIGIGFLYVGIMHAYFQGIAAPNIGWQPSPFEFELGWAEIGVSLVALLSLWRGYEFRLATTLIFAIFSFAAAAQHVVQFFAAHNSAPGNIGFVLWFGDMLLPLIVLVLAMLSREDQPGRSFWR